MELGKNIRQKLTEENVQFINNGDEFALIKDDVKAEWVRLGEGWHGDYDLDDPEDEELLRFDVSILENGVWEAVEDASYCTQVPATATDEEKLKLLKIILDNYYDELHNNHSASVKKLGEWLSWISLNGIKQSAECP